jgi:acyl dehydratase
MALNYGCDRVRFPAPVRGGARLRGRGTLLAAEPLAGNAVQATFRLAIEVEGSDKPACVVDSLARFSFEA